MAYAIVQVIGLTEAINEMRAFINATKNMVSINQLVGEYVLDFFTDDVYESQGNVFGHPWPEVKMPYAAYKTKKWGPQLTLIASGKMRASNVLYTTNDMIRIRNEARSKSGRYYAIDHQEGGQYLPKRVLMDLDFERKQHIGDMILDDLQRRKDMGR